MPQNLRNQGIMLILSSPSGAGKTSLSRALVNQDHNTLLSISVTTRKMREGEVDGKDYHFVSQSEFDDLVKQDAFLEYANVFGNNYGTLAKNVDHNLNNLIDVVFDIEWQGAAEMRRKKEDNVVSIYILPPSLKVLKERLKSRRQDSNSVIESRMQEAEKEISHYGEYDYIVINENFDEALKHIQSILTAERLKRTRLNLLNDFVENL